jgi:hypothetical protein
MSGIIALLTMLVEVFILHTEGLEKQREEKRVSLLSALLSQFFQHMDWQFLEDCHIILKVNSFSRVQGMA